MANISTPISVLGLDPGNTTGWAHVVCWPDPPIRVKLLACGQIQTTSFDSEMYATLDLLLCSLAPSADVWVMESYNIYQDKIHQHTWSDVPTLRLIGFIQCLAALNCKRIEFQTAATGKSFMTDDRLKKYKMYQTNRRHANDAIRHCLSYLMFNRNRNKNAP